MEKDTSVETTSFAIYNKWYAFIPSDVLLHADYVDYYVKAANAYRTTTTPVRRMNQASGIRPIRFQRYSAP